MVFWPRSAQPYLLLLNASASNDAAFGTIELEAATVEPVPSATSTEKTPEARSVALYLSRPFLADAFGARRNLDPATRRPLDTWNTWQQAAERFDALHATRSFNTLVLTSLNDGGAIFHSSGLIRRCATTAVSISRTGVRLRSKTSSNYSARTLIDAD